MAEEAKKKADAPAGGADKGAKKEEAAKPAGGHGAAEAGKGGLLSKTPVLLGGVMLLEAVVLFAGFKFLGAGGPKPAAGAELAAEATAATAGEGGGHEGAGGAAATIDPKKSVEIQILGPGSKFLNKQSGRAFIYDVQIFAVTKASFKDRVEETIKEREALIQDRIRTIIAQNDPDKLGGGSEPGLETLRRQVKYQLDEIVGQGIIDEVLVPRCIPFRADY